MYKLPACMLNHEIAQSKEGTSWQLVPTGLSMNRTRSHEIFTRARQLIPGGVNSPARAFGGVGGEPLIIAKAAGAYLYDVDGNRLIDYIGSWGPIILGHCHPRVTASVHASINRGTSYGAPTEAE